MDPTLYIPYLIYRIQQLHYFLSTTKHYISQYLSHIHCFHDIFQLYIKTVENNPLFDIQNMLVQTNSSIQFYDNKKVPSIGKSRKQISRFKPNYNCKTLRWSLRELQTITLTGILLWTIPSLSIAAFPLLISFTFIFLCRSVRPSTSVFLFEIKKTNGIFKSIVKFRASFTTSK